MFAVINRPRCLFFLSFELEFTLNMMNLEFVKFPKTFCKSGNCTGNTTHTEKFKPMLLKARGVHCFHKKFRSLFTDFLQKV